MSDMKWSDSERKRARQIFDEALDAEKAEVLAEFKARAAAVADMDELWGMEDFLSGRRHAMDAKYDYRYSQLIRVFGRLLREGRITREQLAGLSSEKQALIMRWLEDRAG